jgi:hypothetical protein
MRTPFQLLVIVVLSLFIVASCEKEDQNRIINTSPVNPRPDPITRIPEDTIIAQLQLIGPYMDPAWGETWREEAIILPQLTKSNVDSLRVFVAQDTTKPWQEVARRQRFIPHYVNYSVCLGCMEKNILLIAIEPQTEIPTVDFTKEIAVKITFKSF